jgi:hypothetical protein
MLKRITNTTFFAAVVVIAAASAVWLTITGHTLQPGGMLLALWAALATVMFSLRLAEGFGRDRLSIWAGPVWSVRVASPTAPAFPRGLYAAHRG